MCFFSFFLFFPAIFSFFLVLVLVVLQVTWSWRRWKAAATPCSTPPCGSGPTNGSPGRPSGRAPTPWPSWMPNCEGTKRWCSRTQKKLHVGCWMLEPFVWVFFDILWTFGLDRTWTWCLALWQFKLYLSSCTVALVDGRYTGCAELPKCFTLCISRVEGRQGGNWILTWSSCRNWASTSKGSHRTFNIFKMFEGCLGCLKIMLFTCNFLLKCCSWSC